MNRMDIRPATLDDFDEIERIWKKHHQGDFNIPSLRGILTHAVVTNGKGIVGFGMVKVLGEAIMILDHDAPLRQKVETVKLLMDKALRDSGGVKIGQLHVFVKDPQFAKILKDHFNFHPCVGEVLVTEV